jgi:hypothetical protein
MKSPKPATDNNLKDIWVVLYILFIFLLEVRIRNVRWFPPLNIGEHGKNTRTTQISFKCRLGLLNFVVSN